MCDRGQKLLQQIVGSASIELARRKIFSDSWRYSSFPRTALDLHIHELLLNRASFVDSKFWNLDQTVALVGLLMISNHNNIAEDVVFRLCCKARSIMKLTLEEDAREVALDQCKYYSF